MEQPKQEEKLKEQTVRINVCIPKLVRITKRKEFISKLEIKQKIVEEAKVVNNIAQVARKHGLSEDTIQYWCKKEDDISEYFFQTKLWFMFVSMYFVHMHFINYFYTDDSLYKLREIPSLTPPPMKKPRIDAAESKIMKISDLPDLESGVKIWRKALEQRDVALEVAKSNEVGYKSRMEFLEQKIEKLESKVDINLAINIDILFIVK